MIHSQGINIAIVHRDALYRDSLRYCLTQTEPISIVHSASGIDQETWNTVVSRGLDLLILEFSLCRCHGQPLSGKGLNASTRGIKTIVIGVPNTEEDILVCIEEVGAAGYLLMNARLDDLLNNISAIMRGETLCSPRVASLAFNRLSALARRIDAEQTPTSHGTCLTRREEAIIRLIDEGLSNKEIAVRLNIEVSTVKNHVHNILDKLQLPNRHSVAKHVKERIGLASSV